MGFRRAFSGRTATWQLVVWLTTVSLVGVGVGMWGSGTAAADAGRGFGVTNVTTDMFTHPWQGGWVTDVGTAWCIVSGSKDPRAVGNIEIGDVPAERGVSLEDRRALSYAIWAYGQSTDPVTAAGLATVVHGLSGDDHASTDIASMAVSHPEVRAEAVRIWHEARARAHWLDGPWNVDVRLEWMGSDQWRSTITYTDASGRPVAGHEVDVLARNVGMDEGSETIRKVTTGDDGTITQEWHQHDPSTAVTVLSGAWMPGYYRVWQGPDYPSGSVPQQVVTATGSRVDGGASRMIPTGRARVRKATSNPTYQTAAGATFEVQPVGGGGSLGVLVVGDDGMTGDVELVPGRYRLVEVAAPPGVKLDPTPHEFVIEPYAVVTVELVDDVERSGVLGIAKVDENTGERVGGAVVEVARDSDGDGIYDEMVGRYTLGDGSERITGLAAGVYEVTEVEPPPGYLLGEVTSQFVVLAWDGIAEVTFSDHAVPTVTTHTGSDAAEGVVGDITVPLGAAVRDVVVVNGLGAVEQATVLLRLYGPFASPEESSDGCAAEKLIWTTAFDVVGPGEHPSPEFVPAMPGSYGFVATLSVPGLGDFGGSCGEPGESVTVRTPKIATEAQAQEAIPGGSVSDLALVDDLAPGVEAVLVTALYGPFEDEVALAGACDAGALGEPVATVSDPVVGPGRHRSSSIDLPTGQSAGIYTFMATLDVEGVGEVAHGCGEQSETFAVVLPTIPRIPIPTAPGMPTLPRTGWPVLLVAGVGAVSISTGVALSAAARGGRRRRTVSP